MDDTVEVKRTVPASAADLAVGEVADRNAIVSDDLIGTGTTLRRAAAKCREAGARRVYAAATHGLSSGNPLGTVGAAEFDGIIIGDTARSAAKEAGLLPENVVTLDTSRLLSAEHCHR